jgi:hypothetical protein
VLHLSNVRTPELPVAKLSGFLAACAIYRDGDATDSDVDRLMDKAFSWSVRTDIGHGPPGGSGTQ